MPPQANAKAETPGQRPGEVKPQGKIRGPLRRTRARVLSRLSAVDLIIEPARASRAYLDENDFRGARAFAAAACIDFVLDVLPFLQRFKLGPL